MSCSFPSFRQCVLAVLMPVAGLILCDASTFAQTQPHQTLVQPGGVPGWPVMTGIERATNGFTLTWDGPPGYYRVYQKRGLLDSTWTQVGTPQTARQATITTLYSNAFFKVQGPSPRYAGAQVCAECHATVHDTEQNTRHARAFETLQNIGQDKNPGCVPCHTVGYGLPTGFAILSNYTAASLKLAGVQCENCHGPGAAHASDEENLAVRPRRDIAGQICGGCHTGSHHPTYNEWSGSGHFVVTEDMSLTNRVDSCGRCHSGSARLTLLSGKSAMTVTNDANVGITCVVCHDPHQNTAHPAQLRNPVASTNDYSLSTRTNFASAYNPNINLCAQCHNHRGASFSSADRAPHHSPQYNMLIGTIGELAGGVKPNQPAYHARLEKQCVTCHMVPEEYQSEAHPAVTGHSFRAGAFDSCYECHPLPEFLVYFTQAAVSNQVRELKIALDRWGETKAPLALRNQYGARSWEYVNPGSLTTGTTPNAAEQAQIPVDIQKARFNLYLVLYDGSYGVHNGPHAIRLLDAARVWIQTELEK